MTSVSSSVRRLLAFSLTAVLLGGTLLAGCDFLDKDPKGQLTSENFFTTPDHAVQATNATYSMLRDWQVHVFAWLGVTSIASDNATKGSTPSDASFLLEMDNLTFDAGNIAFNGVWSGYYSGIYRANVAIQNIPGIDMESQRQTRLLGENRFLRAYFYFFLVRAYGGVPKITAPLKPSEFDTQTRASQDSIYALIERDLEFAIDALPSRSQYSASQKGRVTQGAARGLLAKAHLYQEEFDAALQHAEAVINSGEYSLLDDYFTIFRPEGEFSSGSIFEVNNAALEAGGGSSQYPQVQGVRGTPSLGWGFNQPSPDLEQSYEPGDPRQQATILYPWETTPDEAKAPVHINPNIPNQRYNEKAQAPVNTPGGSGNSTVNIRRLRLADVMLIAAEASARTGNEAQARDYLNQVRERAREGRSVTLGITPEQMATELATTLGLSDDGHVFVRYAKPPAAAAGVETFRSSFREGGSPLPVQVETAHVIEAVNGTAVTTTEEYVNALEAVSPGETVTLDLLSVSQDAAGSTSTQDVSVDVTAQPLLPDVQSSGQQLLRDIWHERRVELAMEQHRWFDLIRQGRAQEVMADLGKDFQDRHTLYPIPQSEIDLSGIEQNPGY
jgi:hypothetical protein